MRRTGCLRAAEILSGVAISNEIRKRVRDEVSLLSRAPKLAVVLVGSREDSHRYVKHKRIAAEKCGIAFQLIQLPPDITQAALHKELAAVNSDPTVDGVLLQLPLPPHLRARAALFHIHPGKDVDGLHPLNAGNLFLQDQSPLASALSEELEEAHPSPPPQGTAANLLVSHGNGDFGRVSWRSHERKYFIPCTALAVRTLLFSYLRRKQNFFSRVVEDRRQLHAVVVNKSMVVGVPTAAILLKEPNFMVTVCSRSDSLDALKEVMRRADVVITAYGVARVFDESFFKEGAIAIDVAINSAPPVEGLGEIPRSRLCGDVDIASASNVLGAITPTPGGVGPLTVAHLMQNVLKAYHLRNNNKLFYNNVYASFLRMYGTPGAVAATSLRNPFATPTGCAEDDPQDSAPNAAEAQFDDEDDEADDDDADNSSYDV